MRQHRCSAIVFKVFRALAASVMLPLAITGLISCGEGKTESDRDYGDEAGLDGLVLSAGELDPAFDAETTYYSDRQSGTAEAPLKTIGAAIAKTEAGATVWIAAGTYREALAPRSDTTLRALPNADVRIKGSDLVAGWTLLPS